MTVNQNLKNIFSLLTMESFSRLIGFIALTYLARVLSKSSFGIINLALAVVSYGMIISNSGLSQYGTRKIISSEKNGELIIGEILFARFFVSLAIFLFVLAAVLFFVSSPAAGYTILLYNLALFPAAFLVEWFFYGYQKINIISAGRILGMAVYMVIVLSIVQTPDDIEQAAVAWIAGAIVNTLYLLIVLRKLGFGIKIQFSITKYLLLLKESFHLSIASIIGQVVVMFPIVYLGMVSTASEVGTFSAALKIIILFLAVDRIFSSLFFPKISKCFIDAPHTLRDVFMKTLKWISVFSFGFSIMAFICSEMIITTVFGNKFSDAVSIFQVLIAYFTLTLINSIFAFTLIGMNSERIYSKAVAWGLLIFLVCTVALTHTLGIAGAAAGLVVFECASFMIMSVNLERILKLHFIKKIILPFFSTGVFILLLTFLALPFYGQLLLALFVGVPVIALLGGISLKELQFIKKVFG